MNLLAHALSFCFLFLLVVQPESISSNEPSILGYPNKRSFVAGEIVSFHLSSSAPKLNLVVARMGLNEEIVWSKKAISATTHPIPSQASSHGCDWPAAASISIPKSWKTGVYEAWAEAAQNNKSAKSNRMFFVVRSSEPGEHSKILLQLSTNTYNAYNGWGGYSLYTYWGKWNVKHKPGDVLGRRVTFQRPFNGMDKRWELPFIQWAEKNGYPLDYAINSDLEFHPELLKRYKLVLSVGHDEYWSAPMRDHLETFIAKGGNVAFFSGNTCCWQVRFDDEGKDMVCWKEAVDQDPLYKPEGHPLLSTLWSHHLVKRPENQLTGVGFLHGGFHKSNGQLLDESGAYTVHRPDHWVFSGTGLIEGQEFGGDDTIVGYECDGAEFIIKDGKPVPTGRDGTPKNFIILATAPARWGEGDLGWYKKAHDQWKSKPHEHGTMGIYTKPNGGTVFTAATTDWSHGLKSSQRQTAQGSLGPGHKAGVFKGGAWNALNNHFKGKVIDENGKPLPYLLSIEFGAAGQDQPIKNWGKINQNYHLNSSAPQGVGNNELMNDMLWSSGDREQAGVRIRNLPKGTYEVFALLRHFAAPIEDRYEWAVGKNIHQVKGNSFVRRGGSRTEWMEAKPTQDGNYARAKITIEKPDDAITMIYDNLDRSFSDVMGFQIAKISGPDASIPNFRIQFDVGGKGSNPVPQITKNVIERLSGMKPGKPVQKVGSVPKERPAIRPASALKGWADWDRAKEIFKRVQVPAAPVRTAEEQLQTFKLAEGYKVELVASEPMIANPVFFEFDADGRIWALEYRGYMRDLDGNGEADPSCRMVIMEDTDEDGRADKSITYLDQLVMPRSFAFVEGGVLLAEPPNLWYCRDTDNDFKCDVKERVGHYGVAGNPQHTANGLRRGIDNWLHSADWGQRHRFQNGRLIIENTLHRGQFGVSFDDLGRFISCRENIAAVQDYIPEEYIRRNPHLWSLYKRGGNRDRFGIRVHITRNAQEVFPIRPTPQITLGGLELRDDGTLRTYTIASGTCFYRGDQFPEDAYGNLFVPEAGGHLIGRLVLDGQLQPKAKRFYPPQQELLASTDERFRPINARTGPDGALYIADLYKGVIEHVIFMVPWLANQIKERNLETGNDKGRIWRIVSTKKPISRRSPQLSSASPQKLVSTLESPNGWRRDTAQRLLIDQKKYEAIPHLKKMVSKGRTSTARRHALWTLSGMQKLDWKTVSSSLTDPHPYVRATGLRVLELIYQSEHGKELLESVKQLILEREEKNPIVLQQALLSLGILKGSDDLFSLFISLLKKRNDPLGQTALLSSLNKKESAFLDYLLKDYRIDNELKGLESFLPELARIVSQAKQQDQIERLLNNLSNSKISSTVQRKILEGLLSVKSDPINLSKEPSLIKILADSDNPQDNKLSMRLRKYANWPGNTPWQAVRIDLKPLTPDQVELTKLGAEKYAMLCASCHQADGSGAKGLAPPLSKSEWVNGSPETLAQIVLKGLVGPIEVRGKKWNLYMPGLADSGIFNDREFAAILTFIRRAWGNRGDPISPSLITQQRKLSKNRTLPWTAEEFKGKAAPVRTQSIQANQKGIFVLQAQVAELLAQRLRYHPNLDLIGPWVLEGDAAMWQVDSKNPGTYRVKILYAMDDKNKGNSFVIESNLSYLSGKVASTGGFDKFVEEDFGAIKLKKGINRILMRPKGAPKGELIDLRTMRLVPIEK